jgi:tetratricopeptide (TPR) repeat protein
LGGWGTRGTGQYERGIRAAEECLRLNPDLSVAYDALAVNDISLGRFAEAEDALRRPAERKVEIPNFLVNRYYLAFLKTVGRTKDALHLFREYRRQTFTEGLLPACPSSAPSGKFAATFRPKP